MHRINNIIRWLCFLVLLSACQPTSGEQKDYSELPKKSQRYAKYYEGHENPSRAMAQIEQESSWNPYALSRTGAQGHAQIMPPTGKWGARTFARHLGPYRPHNPAYAAEFHKAYMNYFTVDLLPTYCGNLEVDEKRYNGGFYIIWELKYSDGTLAGAKSICGSRMPNGKKRSKSNCKENYDYSVHIARRQTKYLSMGGVYCPTTEEMK